jgi:hypothetical protein
MVLVVKLQLGLFVFGVGVASYEETAAVGA